VRLSLPRRVALVLALGWSAALFWLLISREVSKLPLAHNAFVSNCVHAGLFGLEALLLGLAWASREIGRPRGPWLVASLVALAYAGALELGQGLVGRHASWWDMGTNAVGVLGSPWALEGGRVHWGRAAWALAATLVAGALSTWAPGWLAAAA